MITTLRSLEELVQDMMGRPVFAFDVETSGLDAHYDRLLGLSFTYENDEGRHISEYVVFEHTSPSEDDPFVGIPRDYIDRDAARDVIKPLFDQEDVVMVAHNAAFDLKFLWKWGVDPKGQLFDTMIAEFVINENRPTYGLKETAARVFGAEMDKYADLRQFTNYGKDDFLAVPLRPAAKYAEDDTRYTYRLWERQDELLHQERVEKPFYRMEMPLVRVIAQMEMKGFALDMDSIRKMREEFEAISVESERKVWEAGMAMLQTWDEEGREIPPQYHVMIDHLKRDGIEVVEKGGLVFVRGKVVPVYQPTPRSKPRVPYFNVGSRNQLSDLFYDYYGIEVPTEVYLKPNKDGTPKVDASTLTTIRHFLGEKAPQVLNDLLEWRKADKIIGTYLKPFMERADENDHWALRCNFNQTIARTGRLSASNPNLMNIPSRGETGARVRSLFVARPDHKLIVADYSQLELRLLAHYSQDEHLLHAFKNKLDLHTLTGARQSGLEYDELKARIDAGDEEAKLMRTKGKTANFALSYGMAAKKYQLYLLVNNGMYFPLEEVQRQIDGFNEAYPELYAWKQGVFAKLRETGYVRTIGGRKRRLPEIWSDNIWEQRGAERQAVNVYAQGGGADIMKLSMIKVQDRIREYGAEILVQVHDELVVESPAEHAETVKHIVETTMVEVNKILRCPLDAEAAIGDSWFEAK